jgi:hypothetical protein
LDNFGKIVRSTLPDSLQHFGIIAVGHVCIDH